MALLHLFCVVPIQQVLVITNFYMMIDLLVLPDMDVAECERKRFEFIDDLTDLEKQFAILREQ